MLILVIFLTRMMYDKIFPSMRNKEADSEVIDSAHKCICIQYT